MTDHGYPMVVRSISDEEGGGFIAFAPDLLGCLADGETADAAIADLRLAIDEWIDEAKRLGRDIPQPDGLAAQAHQKRLEINKLIEAQESLIKSQQAMISNSQKKLIGFVISPPVFLKKKREMKSFISVGRSNP